MDLLVEHKSLEALMVKHGSLYKSRIVNGESKGWQMKGLKLLEGSLA